MRKFGFIALGIAWFITFCGISMFQRFVADHFWYIGIKNPTMVIPPYDPPVLLSVMIAFMITGGAMIAVMAYNIIQEAEKKPDPAEQDVIP